MNNSISILDFLQRTAKDFDSQMEQVLSYPKEYIKNKTVEVNKKYNDDLLELNELIIKKISEFENTNKDNDGYNKQIDTGLNEYINKLKNNEINDTGLIRKIYENFLLKRHLEIFKNTLINNDYNSDLSQFNINVLKINLSLARFWICLRLCSILKLLIGIMLLTLKFLNLTKIALKQTYRSLKAILIGIQIAEVALILSIYTIISLPIHLARKSDLTLYNKLIVDMSDLKKAITDILTFGSTSSNKHLFSEKVTAKKNDILNYVIQELKELSNIGANIIALPITQTYNITMFKDNSRSPGFGSHKKLVNMLSKTIKPQANFF